MANEGCVHWDSKLLTTVLSVIPHAYAMQTFTVSIQVLLYTYPANKSIHPIFYRDKLRF